MEATIMLLSFAQYIPYFIALGRRRVQPSVSGWLCFALSLIVTIIASVSLGHYSILIACGLSLLCQLVIIAWGVVRGLAFRPDKTERTILFAVGGSIALWLITGQAELAIYLNIAIDLAGTGLTLKKLLHIPASESLLTWLIGTVGSALSVVYFFNGVSSDFLYLLTIFVSNLVVLLLLAGQLYSRRNGGGTLPHAR
ncbi:hypothetical protein FJU30_23795 [Affinibrenneria salicis]|uniref:PQ-loop repeat-containing protein n=1 Tax=Affinibrenneria salicis TaxID=2590031 RepID=A0A5J5FSE1_9GAMM|nr:hypothetical protein [Affinibrenneria salicis]KAA8995591.1 hypothetical protein FJU30_23795 [Affinibrenneria salicis]